jgi:hypothetical protein
MYSPHLKCLVTDSPGLGDKKIAMPLWIKNFNCQFEMNPRIDVCLVVIEKRERVDVTIVLAF